MWAVFSLNWYQSYAPTDWTLTLYLTVLHAHGNNASHMARARPSGKNRKIDDEKFNVWPIGAHKQYAKNRDFYFSTNNLRPDSENAGTQTRTGSKLEKGWMKLISCTIGWPRLPTMANSLRPGILCKNVIETGNRLTETCIQYYRTTTSTCNDSLTWTWNTVLHHLFNSPNDVLRRKSQQRISSSSGRSVRHGNPK